MFLACQDQLSQLFEALARSEMILSNKAHPASEGLNFMFIVAFEYLIDVQGMARHVSV